MAESLLVGRNFVSGICKLNLKTENLKHIFVLKTYVFTRRTAVSRRTVRLRILSSLPPWTMNVISLQRLRY